jgi:hypothetical protein
MANRMRPDIRSCSQRDAARCHDHVDVRDAIFEVDLTPRLEAVRTVETFQVCLGLDAMAVTRVLRGGFPQCLVHERLRPKYGRMYNFDDAQPGNVRLMAMAIQPSLTNR